MKETVGLYGAISGGGDTISKLIKVNTSNWAEKRFLEISSTAPVSTKCFVCRKRKCHQGNRFNK